MPGLVKLLDSLSGPVRRNAKKAIGAIPDLARLKAAERGR